MDEVGTSGRLNNTVGKNMKTIGIIGEYTETSETHIATNRAIEHSRDALGLDIDFRWISTEKITEAFFEEYDSLWVAPRSPYKNMNNALCSILQKTYDIRPSGIRYSL